jgi:predicted DNA-binding transcriptional regulator YafY
MAEDKPRLVRLAAILTQLQSKRIITATEIAEKHNVSIRTIYRDIRTLEQSGIPIVTEEGKGYSMMAGYTLPPVMLTQEEANALITAEQLILKNRDTSLVEYYQNAVMKVKSVMRFSQKERDDFLSSRMQIRNKREEGTSNYLIQLQTAVVNYQVVKITYVSLENQTSERFIEPFAVYTTQENWIMIAFCRLRKDFRAFRLDCIQNMEIVNEHFEPHKITLEQYLEKCRKKFMDTPDTPLSYK